MSRKLALQHALQWYGLIFRSRLRLESMFTVSGECEMLMWFDRSYWLKKEHKQMLHL